MFSKALKAIFAALTGIVLLAGCASYEKQRNLEAVPEIRPGILQGYLPVEALPDSLAPPAEGTTSLALDEAVSHKSLALRGTER